MMVKECLNAKLIIVIISSILYSAKCWRGKTLANPEQFAKVLPIQLRNLNLVNFFRLPLQKYRNNLGKTW